MRKKNQVTHFSTNMMIKIVKVIKNSKSYFKRWIASKLGFSLYYFC